MSAHLIDKVTRDRSLLTQPHPLLTNDEIIEVFNYDTLLFIIVSFLPSLSLTQQILSFCSTIDVTLQSDAHQLLTSYYVASRRLRGSGTPLTALNTL